MFIGNIDFNLKIKDFYMKGPIKWLLKDGVYNYAPKIKYVFGSIIIDHGRCGNNLL